jgi:hypothetical protein
MVSIGRNKLDVGFVALRRNRQFQQQCVVFRASDRVQSLKSKPARLRSLDPRYADRGARLLLSWSFYPGDPVRRREPADATTN